MVTPTFRGQESKCSLFALFVPALIFSSAIANAQSAPTFYVNDPVADRQAFQLAVGGATTLESFEGEYAPGTSLSFPVGGPQAFTVTSGSQMSRWTSLPDRLVTDGTASLSFSEYPSTTVVFTFDTPISAFGVDVLDMNFGTMSYADDLGNVANDILVGDNGSEAGGPGFTNIQFFGVTNTEAFTSVSLTFTNNDPGLTGTLAVDRLEFGESAPPPNYFTLAVVPDTQMYVEQHPEILMAQMNWIVANQAAENIIYVSHLGDLKDDTTCDNKTVNNGVGNGRTEWQIVNDAFTILDNADIPYGVVAGNHDFEQISSACPTDYSCAAGESETCAQRPLGIEDTSIATFNSVLGPSRFDDVTSPGYQPTYGDLTGVGASSTPDAGSRRPNTNEDNFSLVDFGGVGLVVINLGYREDDNALATGETSVCNSTTNPEIAWADGLLSEYSDRLGIVTSHAFLVENTTEPGRNEFNPYGQSIYTCLSDNPNFLMMMSAHRWGEAWRREITGRSAALPVHALLSDYQRVNYLLPGGGVPTTDVNFRSLDADNPFADGGFMRLMRFDLTTGVVSTRTIAPAVSFADPATGAPLTYPDDSAGAHGGHWHVGRTGSMERPGLESVYTPAVPVNSATGRIRFNSGAGMHQDTASNFCFTYRGYRVGVTEPAPDGAACPITFFDP